MGGIAAQNGTAVGRVIELWHRNGEDDVALIDALHQARIEGSAYPDADWDLIEKWARLYSRDERNHGTVVASLQEAEVRLTIPAAPEDPTGEPIEIVGHVDQIRRHPVTGGLSVWDLKSGAGGGEDMTRQYAWQLAAYSLGATETLGMGDVLPGGILRVRGYVTRQPVEPNDALVQFHTGWSLDQCRTMMDTVAFHVANLRRGVVPMNPGSYCRYCPGRDPSTCGREIGRVLDMEQIVLL